MSAKPKLLVLSSTYPRWNGDTQPAFVHDLSRRLCGDFEVVVLCPRSRGATTNEVMDGVGVIRYRYAPNWLETLGSDGGILSSLKARPLRFLLLPLFLLSQLFATYNLVRSFRPDVIHAHWIVPQGFVVTLLSLFYTRRTFPPILVTSHGSDLYGLSNSFFRMIKKCVLNKAAWVSVVSEGMKVEMAALGVDRVSVIPMGVDLDGMFSIKESPPSGEKNILFVGRLVHEKGLHHLVDALHLIVGLEPTASLVVVGHGPERESLERRAEQLGIREHVSFVGALRQSELPSFYRRSTVFVPFIKSSHQEQEGLGLVVVEALGCGCSVVASDIVSIKYLSEFAPISRIPVGGEVGAIAEAILDAMSENECSDRKYDYIPSLKRVFNWSAVADRYSECLGSILSNEKGG